MHYDYGFHLPALAFMPSLQLALAVGGGRLLFPASGKSACGESADSNIASDVSWPRSGREEINGSAERLMRP